MNRIRHVAASLIAFVIIGVLTNCSAFFQSTDPETNNAPVAYAGDDQYVTTGDSVYLYGHYTDEDDDVASGYWEMVQKPSGSAATLSSSTAQTIYFTADIDGTYIVKLVVFDGTENSQPDYVNIYATGTGANLKSDPGLNQVVTAATVVHLDGSASLGGATSYQWSFITKPTASQAEFTSSTNVTTDFTADVLGVYEISLVISDGTNFSEPVIVVVTACDSFNNLGFRIIDAEYSKSLDKIVAIGTAPNVLYIYDPAADSQAQVSLPLAPTCVSVSPDGNYAAVGYNAYLSYINLTTGALVKTISTTTEAVDIVLAGNGYAYVFPKTDQWESIHSVNIATGVETTAGTIRAGTKAKLHPAGTKMYGADNGLSPSDIERYDIVSGIASVAYDSPYHGEYSMGGDLWISEDGLRIFVRGGSVFRATDSTSDDMTYNGALADLVVSLTHSTSQDALAVIHASADDEIAFYTYDYLSPGAKVGLPTVVSNGADYSTTGKYIFYSADGSEVYVIVQADDASGILNDFYVAAYNGSPSTSTQGRNLRNPAMKTW